MRFIPVPRFLSEKLKLFVSPGPVAYFTTSPDEPCFRILDRSGYAVEVDHLLLYLLRCALYHPSRFAGTCILGAFVSTALLPRLIFA